MTNSNSVPQSFELEILDDVVEGTLYIHDGIVREVVSQLNAGYEGAWFSASRWAAYQTWLASMYAAATEQG